MVLFDLIIIGFLDFLQWYSNEALSGANITEFLSKQLAIYIILQMLLYCFPFLQKILNILCLPFRWIHVFLHASTAKQICQEIESEKEEENNGLDYVINNNNMRSSMISGLNRDDEKSSLIMSFDRLEHAKRVAFAPNRIALIMCLGYLVVAPLTFVNSQLLSTQLGALIHLYFFMGIFGVMMPSINDWNFVFNTLLLDMNIRPIFLYNSILVYVVFTFDCFWRTSNFFLAVLVGTLFFFIYLVGLVIIAYIARGKKAHNNKVRFIVDDYPKNKGRIHSRIQLLEEDLNI